MISLTISTLLRPTLYALAALLGLPLSITLSITLSFLLLLWRRTTLVPSHLPWSGTADTTFFPKTRALLREARAKRGPITQGYADFAARNQPFVLPAMHWPDVALPPSENAWLIAQPDSVLSTVETQDELLMLEFFGPGPDQAANHDFGVVMRDLTRQMGRLLPALREEVEACFEELFRPDEGEEWKEVVLYEAVEMAARRGVNRIFVGAPMCRDERVVRHAYQASIMFSLCGAVLRTLVPGLLRPLFAPLVGLPYYYHRWRLHRLLRPTIAQRMHDLQHPSEKTTPKPNDGLQWILSSAHDPATNTSRLTPLQITGKTLLLNFFAVFTTSITAGTVLYDILLHHPTDPSLLSQLRTEASTTLPLLPTDPTATRQMPKLDSTIRETLRYNPMFARGIQRKVVRPAGLTTPSGLFLPHGTHVCALVAPMQRDPTLLAAADEYRPLRYYRDMGEKQTGATQISADFLSFSLGKHACPGRFFAVQTMKVMVGWLLVNYEFEVLGVEGKAGGPEWLEIGEARLPPQGKEGRVRVRRRRVVEDREGGGDEGGKEAEEEGESLI